jgi:hypothetical protein
MDVADTCEVLYLEAVVVDTGPECLVRISPSRHPKILALRVRPLHRVQCDKVSQIRVYFGNGDSMLMEKHRLAVIHRHTPKGKLRLQSVIKIRNVVLTHMQGKL